VRRVEKSPSHQAAADARLFEVQRSRPGDAGGQAAGGGRGKEGGVGARRDRT
jgi:hypothetical protein